MPRKRLRPGVLVLSSTASRSGITTSGGTLISTKMKVFVSAFQKSGNSTLPAWNNCR